MARRVSCFPSTDDAFCRAAEEALAQIDGTIHRDLVEFALGDALRPAYPRIQVHRQDGFARLTDEDVWYAYRDGRPIHP